MEFELPPSDVDLGAEQEGLEINKQDEFDLERKLRLKIHENMKIVLSIVFLFT